MGASVRARAATACSAALMAGLLAGQAGAQTPPAEAQQPAPAVPGEVTVLEPLTIGADRATTATKTDTRLIETPQSISVVPQSQITDQGAKDLQDALRYSTSVRAEPYGTDTRQSNLIVRGFYPMEYLDGMIRVAGAGTYPLIARSDPWTLERIEILRGPSSVLYGAGTTGGVVNMVSRRPQFDFGGEIGVQFGSYFRKQLQFDVTGALNEERTLAGRLTGVVRNSDMQTKYVPDDRYLVQPSFTWRPDNKTNITLISLFQRDETASSQQFLPVVATLHAPSRNRRLPDSSFLGEPSYDKLNTEQTSGTLLVDHRFTDWLKLHVGARLASARTHFAEIYPDVYSNPLDPFIDPQDRILNRFAYETKHNITTYTTDSNLQFDFITGPLTHKVLAGIDYVNFRMKSSTGSGATTPIDAYDPVYGNFVRPAMFRNPNLKQSHVGFYVQDQIRYADRVHLVIGARRDRATAEVQGSRPQVDHATSFRAGLIVDVGFGLSPYVSYSESFLPVLGLDLFNRPFKPQRGYQYEAGIKWQPEPGILAMISVFDIRETNRPTNDPDNVLNVVQTGEVRSRGVEVEASWTVADDFVVLGSYTYTDAEVKKSGFPWEVGAPLEGVPEHAASIWGVKTFRVNDEVALRVGAGLRYVGEAVSTSADRKLTTPDYLLVDALLAVDWQKWSLALSANNLTDKRYYTVCRTFGDCFVGNRRSVIATLSRRF